MKTMRLSARADSPRFRVDSPETKLLDESMGRRVRTVLAINHAAFRDDVSLTDFCDRECAETTKDGMSLDDVEGRGPVRCASPVPRRLASRRWRLGAHRSSPNRSWLSSTSDAFCPPVVRRSFGFCNTEVGIYSYE